MSENQAINAGSDEHASAKNAISGIWDSVSQWVTDTAPHMQWPSLPQVEMPTLPTIQMPFGPGMPGMGAGPEIKLPGQPKSPIGEAPEIKLPDISIRMTEDDGEETNSDDDDTDPEDKEYLPIYPDEGNSELGPGENIDQAYWDIINREG